MEIDLEKLEQEVRQCSKCNLCKNRTNTVFGDGNKNAEIMFIGEGPGADEDEKGEPFVGKAGKLMDKALIRTRDKKRRTIYCKYCKM